MDMFLGIALLLTLFLGSCGPASNPETPAPHQPAVSLPEKNPDPGHFIVPDLEYKTVILAVYPDTIMEIEKTFVDDQYKYDTVVKGKLKNKDYTGAGWEEEYCLMQPLYKVEYTENDTAKAAVLFTGTYVHQHGHDMNDVHVFFFMRENQQWKFLDSLAFIECDIDAVFEADLCKKGFTLMVNSKWDNMGAFSERVSFWTFQCQKLVSELTFWTMSARMSMEEPYETEGFSAEVVIGKEPGKEWQTIYYYGEHDDCSKEIADNLSYCSYKMVYEKGEYRKYPLKEKDRPQMSGQ